jgi:hypothetical protein
VCLIVCIGGGKRLDEHIDAFLSPPQAACLTVRLPPRCPCRLGPLPGRATLLWLAGPPGEAGAAHLRLTCDRIVRRHVAVE